MAVLRLERAAAGSPRSGLPAAFTSADELGERVARRRPRCGGRRRAGGDGDGRRSWRTALARKSKEATSHHCRSSMNRVSGDLLARQAAQETVEQVVETVARLDGRERRLTAGCGPIRASSSGMTSMSTRPLSPTAPRMLRFQRPARSSLSVRKVRIRLLQRLDEGAVGDVLLVDVELARGEVAAVLHDRLLQLLDEAGLADAGQARDEQRAELAAGGLLVLLEDDPGLPVAADHLGDEDHPAGGNGAVQRELADGAGGRVLVPAAHQVVEQPPAALVALLRLLEHQPGDHPPEGGGHVRAAAHRRGGASSARWGWISSRGSSEVNGSRPVSSS